MLIHHFFPAVCAGTVREGVETMTINPCRIAKIPVLAQSYRTDRKSAIAIDPFSAAMLVDGGVKDWNRNGFPVGCQEMAQ